MDEDPRRITIAEARRLALEASRKAQERQREFDEAEAGRLDDDEDEDDWPDVIGG